MSSYLREALDSLSKLGFFDVILPFFIVFVIIFGFLEKVKILGENKRTLNSTVALVISFFFIASLWRIEVLSSTMQYLVFGLLFVFSILTLFGLYSFKLESNNVVYFVGLVITLLIVLFSFRLTGYIKTEQILNVVFHPIVIFFACLIGFIWYVTHDEGVKPSPKSNPKTPIDALPGGNALSDAILPKPGTGKEIVKK